MESSSGEKPEGLEIVSIGALYRGPWDKKYWSSSRGKDRYPYPVGYHALRTKAGVTYKMEIQEGAKGPLFVVTSTSGDSCSGQTPDIAWEYFQKKSGPKAKNCHGKRFSCKIDGIELFGFRNPLIQQLLRELVANVHGVAEQSLMSPIYDEGSTLLERDIQSPESFVHSHVLLYSGKQHGTGRKSRKHRSVTAKVASATCVNRFPSEEWLHDADICTSKQGNGPYLEKGPLKDDNTHNEIHSHDLINLKDASLLTVNCATSYSNASEFENSRQCESVEKNVYVVERDSNSVSLVHNVPLESTKSGCFVGERAIPYRDSGLLGHEDFNPMDLEHKLSTMDNEKHDGSLDSDLERVKLLGKALESDLEESNGATKMQDVDLYIPDSLDIIQGNVDSITLVNEEENPLSNKDELVADKPRPGVTLSCAYELSTSDMSKELIMEIGVHTNCLDSRPSVAEMKPPITESLADAASSEGFVKESQPTDLGRHTISDSTYIDFAGQDLASSMMTLLLPRAVPLLTKTYQRKRVRKYSQESPTARSDLTRQFNNLPFEDEHLELPAKGTERRIKKRETPLETSPSLQDVIVECSFCDVNEKITVCGNQSIIPDSFENDQSLHDLVVQRPFFGSGEGDQSPSDETNNDLEAAQSLDNSDCQEQADCLSENNEGNHRILLPDIDPHEDENVLHVTSSFPVDAIEDIPALGTCDILNNNFHPLNCEVICGEERLHCMQQDISSIRSQNIGHLAQVNLNINSLSSKIDERAADVSHSACAIYASFDDRKVVSRTEDHCSLIVTSNVLPSIGDPRTINEVAGKPPFSHLSAGLYNVPFSESIICRNVNNREVLETSYSDKFLHTTENRPVEVDVSDIIENASFAKGQRQCLKTSSNIPKSEGAPFNVVSQASQNQEPVKHVSSDINDFKVHTCISDVGNNHMNPVNNHATVESHEHIPPFQELSKNSPDQSQHGVPIHLDDKLHVKSIASNDHNDHPCTEHYEDKLCTGSLSEDMKPDAGIVGSLNLIGCYVHPNPVLSVLLIAKEGALHICTLCGLLEGGDRDIFIYKVPVKEQISYPSFLGYTSTLFPVLKDANDRTIPVERSGLQFTPDGQSLILLNCIKAPCCRKKNISCLCSICKLDSCEENAIKIVHVELGYVSMVSKLGTVRRVYFILVCEPNHLVAVEESGELHVWIMDPMWRVKMEEFILPSFDYMSPLVIELKQVPRCQCLIVGHNGGGGFCLWDISKRLLLSKFSTSGCTIFQALPVGLFRFPQEDALATVSRVEDHVKEILAATGSRLFEARKIDSSLSPTGEATAVCLLVSATSLEAHHDHLINELDRSSVGWRLAVLAKDMVLMGSVLDHRASSIAVLSGYGITGTSDGSVYIWELTTGNKLVDLHSFNGESISCIATDAKSGAFVVASDKCELRVYIQAQTTFNN